MGTFEEDEGYFLSGILNFSSNTMCIYVLVGGFWKKDGIFGEENYSKYLQALNTVNGRSFSWELDGNDRVRSWVFASYSSLFPGLARRVYEKTWPH